MAERSTAWSPLPRNPRYDVYSRLRASVKGYSFNGGELDKRSTQAPSGSGPAASTSADTCAAYCSKLSRNMPASLRAEAS